MKYSNRARAQTTYWTRAATNRGVDEASLVTVLIVDELDIDDLDVNLLFHSHLNFLSKLDRVLVIGQAGRKGKYKLVSGRGSIVADEAFEVLGLRVHHRTHSTRRVALPLQRTVWTIVGWAHRRGLGLT